ncbi:MAG: quinone-dependent dihydroorotate dehydrogenase [Alphaproteobacteria bacterium]
MPDLFPLASPLLRALPPETAHHLTLRALAAGLGGGTRAADPPVLRTHLWNRDFPNPIGIAAGFDKDARVPDALLRLGFGFVEIGTVTPRPQPGNPRPRVFRLDADRALINRLGFNSFGLDLVVERMRARIGRGGIVGINIGRNRDSANALADYLEGVRRGAAVADYLVVNVSSPNTPGLRDLQAREALEALLRELVAAREATQRQVPLLVKIAPDLGEAERADIAAVALASGIDGIIVSNTTVARPPGLRSPQAREAGGLSGRPLFAASTEVLRDMYRLTHGRLPLIGVGGVADADDAYAKIRAGASLVQLYTALVFAGPVLLGRIKSGLAERLRRDGFASVGDAVGADHRHETEISIGAGPGGAGPG